MKIDSTRSRLALDFDEHAPNFSVQSVRILAAVLSGVEGVSSVQLTWYGAPQIVATYSSRQDVTGFLRKVAEALRDPCLDFSGIAASPPPSTPVVSIRSPGVAIFEHLPMGTADNAELVTPTWFGFAKRCGYGVLASGAFVLSLVGLIVPGVPTVPFVILTVYLAEKSSPRLQRAILGFPVIGQAMRDWHAHRAIRRSTRYQTLAFMGVLVTVALLTAPPSPGLYVSVAVIGTLSTYMVLRIPVLEEQPVNESPAADRPQMLPLRLAGT